MRREELERIYNDAKEIKNSLECDQETVLVLEERTKNGDGSIFEEVYYSIDVCLYDIFQELKNKTKSAFNMYLVKASDYDEFDNFGEYCLSDIAINSLTNEEIKVIYDDYAATKKLPARYIETAGGLVWDLKRNNLDGFTVIIEDYHKRFKGVFETIIPTENADLGEIDIIISAAEMLEEVDKDDENIFNYLYDEGSWEREQIDKYLKEREK